MTERALNDDTILTNLETTPYLKFPAIEKYDFLRHGFSTKLGGVSRGVFATMNLGFGRGDSERNVRRNYDLLCNSMGIQAKNLVFSDQVHKANVRVATKKDCGKGILYQRDYKEIDAHITNEPGVSLLVFAADCVPIYLVDPVKKAIGLVHSGWRGTVLKIGKETVKKMTEEYGCQAEDMVAVIGPCICKECYEVSRDVAEAFHAAFSEEDTRKFLEQTGEDKFHLDLWEANRCILSEAGLKSENITVSGMCTMCHSDLLFSHRKTNGRRGSMAGFLTIVE